MFLTTFGGAFHLDPGASRPDSGTDVSVYHACYLAVVSHVCFACHHLPPCCDVLHSFRVAQPASGVLSGAVDPGLYGSCVEGLLLCSHPQCLCTVFQPSLFQPLVCDQKCCSLLLQKLISNESDSQVISALKMNLFKPTTNLT